MSLISRTLSLPTLTPSARRSNAGGSRGGQDAVIQSRRRRRKPRLITGLDIGTTKICAIIGSVDEDGRITVLGMGARLRAASAGTVININETVEAVVTPTPRPRPGAVHPREVYVGMPAPHHGVNREGITESPTRTPASTPRHHARQGTRAQDDLPTTSRCCTNSPASYRQLARGITDPIAVRPAAAGQDARRDGLDLGGHNIFRCVRKAALRTSGVVLSRSPVRCRV